MFTRGLPIGQLLPSFLRQPQVLPELADVPSKDSPVILCHVRQREENQLR
jgi:hypothetical protein